MQKVDDKVRTEPGLGRTGRTAMVLKDRGVDAYAPRTALALNDPLFQASGSAI